MGRRRRNAPAKDAPGICQRFDALLRNEFGNSITQMAATLGVSHTALSRVINKGQMPSGQMLEGLARLGRVNLHWLLAGGEEDGTYRGGTANLVPVSKQLLPGPPRATPELLDPVTLPTSSPFLLDAPYWFRVSADSPLVARAEERVAAGDYLLIEAGPSWTGRLTACVGRVVVLRRPENRDVFLARIGDEDLFADKTRYELDTYGLFPAALLSTESRASGVEPASRKAPQRDATPTFYADDVVGVVLERRTLYVRKRV